MSTLILGRIVHRIGKETYTESWPFTGESMKVGDRMEREYEGKFELKIVAVQDGRVYARPLNWLERLLT